MTNINYNDQVVIITGAGTGIGKVFVFVLILSVPYQYCLLNPVASTSYALYFASLGAKVVINDVSKDSAQQVCDEINKGWWYISLELKTHVLIQYV